MDIEELLKELFSATYKSDRYNFHIISSSHEDRIEAIVRLWASRQNSITKIEDLSVKIAMLEAKVFAYEAIISNSNFNTILQPEEAQ